MTEQVEKVKNLHCQVDKARSQQDWFSRAACEIARLSGKPVTFLVALAAVIVWAISEGRAAAAGVDAYLHRTDRSPLPRPIDPSTRQLMA